MDSSVFFSAESGQVNGSGGEVRFTNRHADIVKKPSGDYEDGLCWVRAASEPFLENGFQPS